MSVQAFEEILSGPLEAYVSACKGLGGLVLTQGESFAAAFKCEGDFLKKAATQDKPGDDEFQAMLGPITAEMMKVGEVTGQAPPKDPQENHLTSISESVGILGWIAVDSKPVSFCSDMEGAGEFYLSKILMQYKKTDEFEKHSAFVKAVKELYSKLKAYVKEYHTMKLNWNTGLAAPKPAADSDDEEEAGGGGPLDAFKELLEGPVKNYENAAKDLGGLVAKQAEPFVVALTEQFKLLEVAAKQTKPDADTFQGMLTPIGTEMGKVGEVAAEAPPKDALENHLTAVSESVGALGWVAVDSKPVAYISDMEGAGEFYLSKILMQYKKTDEFPKHDAFVKSLKSVYAELKKYVKEYHTMQLSWNFGAMKPKKTKKVVVDDDEDDGADPLGAFKALLEGPVKNYENAAKDLGGLVAKQAEPFVVALTEQFKLLEVAAKQTKPDADTFQGMLTPIGTEMGKVGEVAAEAPPKDPLENHLTAVSESVGALGWVAVDSKPVSYISDMEGAGEFYLSKILMQYKKTDEFPKHDAFVKSLKSVYAELKKYVKEYHTMQLSWNFGAMKKAKKVVEEDDDEDDGADPLSKFQEILTGPLEDLITASKTLGGVLEKQVAALAEGFKKEGELLTTCSKQTKPGADEFQAMLTPIATEMGKVGEFGPDILPKDPLYNHVTSLAESVNVLGWVAVDSKPVSYVSDCEGAGEFYLSKVLMQYKKTDEFAKHEAFVKAVKALYGDLKKYVKEYHTTQLSWNFGAAKKVKKTKKVVDDDEGTGGSDPIGSFKALLEGPVKNYENAAKDLGGLVAKQAEPFVTALTEQFKLLEVAATQAKPDADTFQGMLTPIGTEMGKVGEVTAEAPPKDPLENHLTAVSESVGALGWVAVDSKPVAYISDMEGAGEFYLSKILMQYKKTDEFPKHDAFVKSLKSVYAELKKYVKEYHTMQLSWNFGPK